jgi:hypothetical protein
MSPLDHLRDFENLTERVLVAARNWPCGDFSANPKCQANPDSPNKLQRTQAAHWPPAKARRGPFQPVHEALRRAAFHQRRKIHDIIMQGIDAALRKRGYLLVEEGGQISEVLAAVREAGIMYETALRALDELPGQIARAEHALPQCRDLGRQKR